MRRRIDLGVADVPEGLGLGDVVGALARALRIKECADCRRRRAKLNRIRVTKRGLKVAR